MKNCTVKELIELLKDFDQNAIVCHMELEGGEPIFSTFEVCRQYDNVSYINDDGDEDYGNVVAIF